MGSDKSFNDARVLRSETTLVKRQLRMLASNLEQGEHNLQDLRKLEGISEKIDRELNTYGSELDRLTDLLSEVAREHGVESSEFRGINQEIGALIKDEGSTYCNDVIITISEWDWIKTRWNANNKLVGTKNIRSDILAIDDVINHAKGVKFTKDKQAWVQGEQEPPVIIQAAN